MKKASIYSRILLSTSILLSGMVALAEAVPLISNQSTAEVFIENMHLGNRMQSPPSDNLSVMEFRKTKDSKIVYLVATCIIEKYRAGAQTDADGYNCAKRVSENSDEYNHNIFESLGEALILRNVEALLFPDIVKTLRCLEKRTARFANPERLSIYDSVALKRCTGYEKPRIDHSMDPRFLRPSLEP